MSDAPAVGFIGLGKIGESMALRLVGWPGGLTVFDVVPEATVKCRDQGAFVASSPAEVAERSTVMFIMVRDEGQVADVLDGADGILRTAAPGSVVAIHSTIGADAPARFAEMAAPSGVHVIDAPVSGGWMGAATGELAVMVGGSDEAVAIARSPLERLGSLVAHLGPLGAGTAAKLARNLITFSSYAAVGEAMRLAEALDIDLVKLGEVVRHSDKVTGGAGSIMIRDTSAPLASDDGLREIFEHALQLGAKDLELVIALGAEAGVDLPLAQEASRELAGAFGLAEPSAFGERFPEGA